jgi:hypothetical protein
MSGLGGFSRGFEDAVSSSDGSSDEVDFDLVSNLAHSPMLAEETHNFLVNDVVMPMVRRSLKRKLLEGRGDGVELNDGHESVMDNVVSSSIKHISLSALYSTLNEGLEMVDLATVLKSDSADKHRPAYLHPYDDGDLSDALKSSLMQAEAVALTKDTEEEGRKREVQNLVNAEVATGISTYIYTQPDGEEVYVVRFDIFPSREDPASTYYAFLELVSVDDDTPVPWVGVRFGAHTAPEFVDVKGVAKQVRWGRGEGGSAGAEEEGDDINYICASCDLFPSRTSNSFRSSSLRSSPLLLKVSRRGRNSRREGPRDQGEDNGLLLGGLQAPLGVRG